MAAKVFINYRRNDSAGYVGRVVDRLEKELGRDLLFMDVDVIPLATNFSTVLHEEVAKCGVLLAVIGPNWVDARDEHGNRRLDNPNDFVRIEIAAALQRNIPVIPILLDGVRMPKANQLPEDLKELASRNGMEIRHASFHVDMDRLIRGLKGWLTERGDRTQRDQIGRLDAEQKDEPPEGDAVAEGRNSLLTHRVRALDHGEAGRKEARTLDAPVVRLDRAPNTYIFVCHASEDRDVALSIVRDLERRGVPCWIAPRNVRPGHPFDDEIVEAIEECKGMLLVFSDRCNERDYIRREVTVAGESRKLIIPYRIEDAQPKKALRMRLSDLHWIDAFPSQERAIEEVVSILL
jgi:TIR domain